MKAWKKLGLTALLLTLPFSSISQKKYPLGKDKKPTQAGIEMYFNDSIKSITKNIESKHGIEFWHNDVYLDNLELYPVYTGTELGWCNQDGEVIIGNKNYLAYSKKTLPYEIKVEDFGGGSTKTISTTNAFLRGTIYHELYHKFMYQAEELLRESEREILITTLPQRETFEETFIKEAIANWGQDIEGEILKEGPQYIPKKLEELTDPKTKTNVLYLYSPYFVKHFMNEHGLKKGVYIILQNNPPSKEEILIKPKRKKLYEHPYFKRLKEWTDQTYKKGDERIFNPEE